MTYMPTLSIQHHRQHHLVTSHSEAKDGAVVHGGVFGLVFRPRRQPLHASLRQWCVRTRVPGVDAHEYL